MFENKFTSRGGRAIGLSSDIASTLGHSYVGTEHILAGLFLEGTSNGAKFLQKSGINIDNITKKISSFIGVSDCTVKKVNGLTPKARVIIEMAVSIAKNTGYTKLDSDHMMMAIVTQSNSIAFSVLESLNVDILALSYELSKPIAPKISIQNDNISTKNLDKVATDLTLLAQNKKLNDVIGRESEIRRISEILLRKTKNNALIIGQPGVGKTAIVEGLALYIASGDCPDGLKDKRIMSIDLSGVLAGTKYRGEFEERLKNIIDEVKKSPDIILFIDEFHNIIGAGAAEGAIDAANILKPALSRGEIKLIGATTLEEYKKCVEKDAALERRFQKIIIEEPKAEKAIEILKGIKLVLENHHRLKISSCAIEAAVELSERYLPERYLPDKAIDLLDEAGAHINISRQIDNPILKKIEEMKTKKFTAIKEQNYEKASEYRNKELKLKEKITKNQDEILDKAAIYKLIEKQTGIKTTHLSGGELQEILFLEKKISEKVIGQKDAVASLARSIRKSRAGICDPDRPIGSFLFLGPTGVGKTQTAKALANGLFGDEKAFIKIDMSEFMEKHSISKILGAPPGYKGFDSGKSFTDKLREKPYSVVLLDEIEKANKDVLNIFLQILEDGKLTDSSGRVINFKNTIIIMTSNIGADKILQNKKSVGFGDFDATSKNIKDDAIKQLKKTLSAEFLNRIDDIIVFTKLSKAEKIKIAEYILKEIINRIQKKGITLAYNDKVLEYFVDNAKNEEYGARPMRRLIEDSLDKAISKDILNGNLSNGDTAFLDILDEKITFIKQNQKNTLQSLKNMIR